MNDELPEHVDETSAGTVCRHCGGAVGRDGFSTGGLVTATGEFEPVGEDEGELEEEETEQHEAVERMRASAFTDAVRRSRR